MGAEDYQAYAPAFRRDAPKATSKEERVERLESLLAMSGEAALKLADEIKSLRRDRDYHAEMRRVAESRLSFMRAAYDDQCAKVSILENKHRKGSP